MLCSHSIPGGEESGLHQAHHEPVSRQVSLQEYLGSCPEPAVGRLLEPIKVGFGEGGILPNPQENVF